MRLRGPFQRQTGLLIRSNFRMPPPHISIHKHHQSASTNKIRITGLGCLPLRKFLRAPITRDFLGNARSARVTSGSSSATCCVPVDLKEQRCDTIIWVLVVLHDYIRNTLELHGQGELQVCNKPEKLFLLHLHGTTSVHASTYLLLHTPCISCWVVHMVRILVSHRKNKFTSHIHQESCLQSVALTSSLATSSR
jgi:hypothetical protein